MVAIVVTPPINASRLLCQKSSAMRSSFHFSMSSPTPKWICGSIRPGRSVFPLTSITRVAVPQLPCGATSEILSPSIAKSSGSRPFGVTTWAPLSTRS